MTRREKKEIFTTIVKEATQMTSAIEKDRKSEYEEYLYVYFSKFYPVKEEERIGKIEIREGIIESKILIEIRHNNGQVYMTEVPYQKTIAQLEEIKEKSLELLFATIKKIQRYSDIIIEKCKDEKNQQSKNLKKMVEILQRLSGVSGTIRTTYQHSRAILSSKERQEIINSITEIEKLAQKNKIALPPEEKLYQIPKMTQLINSLLEEPSIEDYQYFKLAISYLRDIAKKENKKKMISYF